MKPFYLSTETVLPIKPLYLSNAPRAATLRWQKRVSDATEKVEEELVVTHQVMSDIAKKLGGGAMGGGGLGAMKGIMRERLWWGLHKLNAVQAECSLTSSVNCWQCD